MNMKTFFYIWYYNKSFTMYKSIYFWPTDNNGKLYCTFWIFEIQKKRPWILNLE